MNEWMTVHLKNGHDVYILKNVHTLLAESIFIDEICPYYETSCNKEYTVYVGYVDKSDKMVNSTEIAQTT
jgi:hypothetical protein